MMIEVIGNRSDFFVTSCLRGCPARISDAANCGHMRKLSGAG